MGHYARNMGISHAAPRAVLANYQEFWRPPYEGTACMFLWTLAVAPRAGVGVILPGGDGLEKSGVVVRNATRAEFDYWDPSAPWYSVIRLATAEELRLANDQHADDSERFWAQARIAAGIESGRRTGVVGRFPPLYPREGTATETEITTYMTGWRRVWKRAENEHRPANELRAYEAVARYWTSLNRQGGKA